MKYTNSIRLIWNYSFYLALCVCLTISHAFCQPNEFKLDIREDRISASFTDVAIIEILQAIRVKTQIQFAIHPQEALKEVSADFQSLTFKEAFKQLLSTLNYALVFNSSNEITKVFVFSEGRSAPTVKAQSSPQNRATTNPVEPQESPNGISTLTQTTNMTIQSPEPGYPMDILPTQPHEEMRVTIPEHPGMEILPPSAATDMVITYPSEMKPMAQELKP